MNKNLFDFAEDKFLEKLPTTINEVKQSFEQVKNDTYQQNNQSNNQEFSNNNTMQNSIGAKQLVRVREMGGPTPTPRYSKSQEDNYPNYSNYQSTYEQSPTIYPNQNGLSTVLTFAVVLLLIVLVFAVSFFIFNFI